ncbi:fuculose phosphate aldolase [Marinomonas sp. SBI22]|uniref:class II aldolase/adducin family protein n=1 Tax=unclassified Marinomonas TaxID=196814 RepID=UPI0007AEF3C2|nr:MULTISPECIES: class II aldolase/adducin family protein [unclassified Marinomonas]KZM45737.1 fuculose phosphate aldolase [Marinomonas sp. SBI22]KZM46256.1 fuculose phosphate aldolase [Marinomonas sp. SBI8L]
MKWLSERKNLIESVLKMNNLGINQGASGNASIRVEDGFLITPSGVVYEDLEPEDIVFVDTQGASHPDKINRKPSSEWRFHLDILNARDDLNAIVHTHGKSVATLACLRKEIPPFHYMIALAGGNTIRCAEYETFATQSLSSAALIALEGRKACLLANHGQIACGTSLKQALAIALEVETLADIYLRVLASGQSPFLLTDEQMQEVHARFSKGYGTAGSLQNERRG